MLDVVEPLVEDYGHRLGRGGDDAGIDLSDQVGELLLGSTLSTTDVLRAIALLR